MITTLKSRDNTCPLCDKEFDPHGSAQSRKHGHRVFRITFRRGGKEYRVTGNLCCICITKVSNWQSNSALEGRLQPCARIPFVPAAEM